MSDEQNEMFREAADIMEQLSLDTRRLFEEYGFDEKDAEQGLMTIDAMQQWMVDSIGADDPDPTAVEIAKGVIDIVADRPFEEADSS